MCYREVHCTKHSCGHETPQSERRVDCGSARCRYSEAHDSSCKTCPSSCKQWLRPPQMIATATSKTPCTHCRR
ncbi:hypothetical protein BDQ12DRAFT_618541 [Crucibulum laeve]|uniref:Uncharacterized protein n=1 Tax=Crucibulum laeve TaxID=68775 RepID=A0A5C3LET0_9AGAR|nr:hypothetical protein BDQ12DRAFT_618541 [Crucibulum laeve]